MAAYRPGPGRVGSRRLMIADPGLQRAPVGWALASGRVLISYCKHAERPGTRPSRPRTCRTPAAGRAAGPVAPTVPGCRAGTAGRKADAPGRAGPHRAAPRRCGRAAAGRRGRRRGAVPTLIVVDASILANVIGDDGVDGQRARSEVRAAGELA